MIEASLPLLVTAQQGLNEPRYPSLPGIMKAKKKPIERLSIDDLELNLEESAAKTVILDQFLPPKKEAGKVLSGELSATGSRISTAASSRSKSHIREE